MKTLLLSSVLAISIAGSVFAQLATLPPSSNADGSPVLGLGFNAGASHWENPNTLGRYRLASDENVPLPSGNTWASQPPLAISTRLASFSLRGGTVRAIFLGETAGWLNDFGYTRGGDPRGPDSFTVFSNIQAVSPANVSFGTYVDISFIPGDDVGDFDFWLNATDSFTTANPPPPTANGGVYTVFDQTNSVPYLAPGNVKFAQSPLLVSTWKPAISGYLDVETYLVSIEDWRSDRGADQDRSDFVFALQFFEVGGIPTGDVPVPEPSTYSLVAGVGLVGLAVLRRKRSARSA